MEIRISIHRTRLKKRVSLRRLKAFKVAKSPKHGKTVCQQAILPQVFFGSTIGSLISDDH